MVPFNVVTLAEHDGHKLTGRVAYLEGVTREDLPDLLPCLGLPAPLDAAKGVVTDRLFAFRNRIPGEVVSVEDISWR